MEGEIVSGSNIVKLVNYVFCKRTKQKPNPKGCKRFASVLCKINFPITYILNHELKEYVQKLDKIKLGMRNQKLLGYQPCITIIL